MEQGEDADVVFENSPLFLHLQAADCPEFEAAPLTLGSLLEEGDNEREGQHESPSSHYTHKLNKSSSFPKKIYGWIKILLAWFVPSDKGNQFIDQISSAWVIQSILSNKALEEEDADFLENTTSEENIQDTKNNISWGISKWRVSLAVSVLISYAVTRILSSSTHSMLLYDILVFVISLVLVLPEILRGYCVHNRQREWQNLHTEMSFLVTHHQDLNSLMKKSVRLIQEAELIARGFTIATQLAPIARLEQSTLHTSHRQCIQLRRTVFHVTRECILYFRQATNSLVTEFPLSPDIDDMSNYVASIPLEDYGPCLNTSCVDHEALERHLQEVTDNYSITALKAVSHLCNVHISEFMRRTALCFRQSTLPVDRKNKQSFLFDRFLKALDPTKHMLIEKTAVLQGSYTFHKCSLLDAKPTSSRPHNEPQSLITPVHSAVHSLQLHLQAAMKRVQSLEEQLENCSDESHNIDDMKEGVLTEMNIVKAELGACVECCSEGVNRLEKMNGNQQQQVTKQEPAAVSPPTDKSKQPPIPLFDIEPIIEDQVFEAYTDPDEIDDYNYSWEPLLTKEEKEKKKREKEEALRLLNELKSVISVRAKDREIRERRAVARMQGEDEATAIERMMGEDEGTAIEKMQRDDNGTVKEKMQLGNLTDNAETETDQTDEMDTNKQNRTGSVDFDGNIERDTQDNSIVVPESDGSRHSNFNFIPLKDDEKDSQFCDRESVSKFCYDTEIVSCPQSESHNNHLDEESPDANPNIDHNALSQRLGKLARTDLSFSANVAAMAVARARQMNQLGVQTFGADTFGEDESESDHETVENE